MLKHRKVSVTIRTAGEQPFSKVVDGNGRVRSPPDGIPVSVKAIALLKLHPWDGQSIFPVVFMVRATWGVLLEYPIQHTALSLLQRRALDCLVKVYMAAPWSRVSSHSATTHITAENSLVLNISSVLEGPNDDPPGNSESALTPVYAALIRNRNLTTHSRSANRAR